jgi:hypothetical protein
VRAGGKITKPVEPSRSWKSAMPLAGWPTRRVHQLEQMRRVAKALVTRCSAAVALDETRERSAHTVTANRSRRTRRGRDHSPVRRSAAARARATSPRDRRARRSRLLARRTVTIGEGGGSSAFLGTARRRRRRVDRRPRSGSRSKATTGGAAETGDGTLPDRDGAASAEASAPLSSAGRAAPAARRPAAQLVAGQVTPWVRK